MSRNNYYQQVALYGYDAIARGFGGPGGALSDYTKLENDLISRYIDYEEMDDHPIISSAYDIYCLAKGTKIPLLNGETMNIEDMVDLRSFDDVWVYASDGERLVPAKVKSAQKTGDGQRVIKVRLDDGSFIRCTPNHKFMLRDGKFKEAGKLVSGESLMPLYRSVDDKGYEEICDGDYLKKTHKWVYENIIGKTDGDVIHHVDFNKRNNNPSNFRLMTWEDHVAFHNEHVKNTLHRSEVLAETSERCRGLFKLWNKQRWIGENRDRYSKISSENFKKIWTDDFKEKMKPIQTENCKRLAESGLNRHFGKDNIKFRGDINFSDLIEKIREVGYVSKQKMGSLLGCGYRVVERLVKEGGYKDWTDLKEREFGLNRYVRNHKVVSIEEEKDLFDVYDLTIEGDHHCFAAGDGSGFVIVHNSDDATQPDITDGKSFSIQTEDEVVKERLEDLLSRQLRMEEEIWEIARVMVKYGNDFEELIVKEGEGVVALNFLPPPTVRRIEGDRGELVGFLQDFRGQFDITTNEFFDALDKRGYDAPDIFVKDKVRVFEDWETVHFRLRSRNRKSLYGFGVADNARWIWKRLTLLEDSVILYKLTRSPTRYAFYVDIGDLPPNEARAHLERVKNQFKKSKFINPKTGKADQRFNPLTIDEDFFLATRGGKDSTRIDLLSGSATQGMEDVEYFENKMYAALKIPKAYLSQEQTMSKSSLSQADVRFARTVLRIQRELRNGMKRIARVHLSATNIDPDSTEYEINMTVPSAIFELAKLEVENAKLDLAGRYGQLVSEYWIMSNVLGLSDDEIVQIRKQKKEEVASGYSEQDESVLSGEKVVSSDRFFLSGKREHEKFMEQNFEKLLSSDRHLDKRIKELKGFMQEIRHALPTKSY
jgi:hypothetical protein